MGNKPTCGDILGSSYYKTSNRFEVTDDTERNVCISYCEFLRYYYKICLEDGNSDIQCDKLMKHMVEIPVKKLYAEKLGDDE